MTGETKRGKARRPKRMGLWDWLRAMTWVVMLPVVFAGIAALLTIDRDITAPSWLRDRIEARAADMIGGGSLTFDDMTMRIGRDLHPRVVLRGAVLRDADGAPIARVASVSGLISPRGVIFERSALMQEVALQGARVALSRSSDGTVAVRFDLGGAEAGVAGGLAQLMEQLDAVFERPALVALERIEVSGLVINYADARAGRNWTVDDGQVSLDLTGGQTRLTGDFVVLSGGADVTTLALAFSSPTGSREAEVRLSLDNVNAQDLASQSAALNWLAVLDAPLSADLQTTLDASAEVDIVQATLQIGQGALMPDPGSTPLAFESARARLEYTPATQRIRFPEISLQSDWGRLTSDGQALLQDITDGLPQTFIGQFHFADIALNPNGIYPEPLQVSGASVDLRLRLDPFQIELGQAVSTDPNLPIAASGRFAATPAGWQIATDLTVESLAQDRLFQIWPEESLRGTRAWLSQNLLSGTVEGLRAGFRKMPERAAQFATTFRFSDASVRYLPEMPPIEGGAGFAQIAGGAFDLSLDGGRVLAPQGGAIALAGSSLRIPELDAKPRQMDIRFDADSSLTAAFAVLDRPPVRLMDRIRQPITLADGRAATTGLLSFPLKRVIAGPEVRYDLRSRLRQVRSDVLVPGRLLTAATLDLDVSNEGLEVAGRAEVDGVGFRGTFARLFPPSEDRVARVRAVMDLSPEGLDTLGVTLPAGLVTGRGEGTLALDIAPGVPPTFALNSNLRGITLAIPSIGWSKPPGQEGALTLAGQLGPVPSIDTLTVAAAGLDVEGRIALREGGGLEAARFSSVRIGDWLDAPITLRGRGPGRAPGVEIAGGAIDLRRARFGGGASEGGPVSIRLERLQVAGGLALTNFEGEFDSAGGFSGQFTAAVNRGARIRGTVVPQNGRSAIRLVSDDAGGVVASAGFIKNAVGGALDLTLLPVAGAGTFDGTLSVRNIRVRDAPSIAALLDAISVVGLLQQLDGQGLAFEEVDARFRLSPSRVVVTQASAVGPGLGISLDGIYTLASKQLEFQGVISPFYLINSIGSVLTRRGEGLIGFNFTLGGTSDAPEVGVNPLSALTPGMFREIFRRPPPQVTE